MAELHRAAAVSLCVVSAIFLSGLDRAAVQRPLCGRLFVKALGLYSGIQMFSRLVPLFSCRVYGRPALGRWESGCDWRSPSVECGMPAADFSVLYSRPGAAEAALRRRLTRGRSTADERSLTERPSVSGRASAAGVLPSRHAARLPKYLPCAGGLRGARRKSACLWHRRRRPAGRDNTVPGRGGTRRPPPRDGPACRRRRIDRRAHCPDRAVTDRSAAAGRSAALLRWGQISGQQRDV